MREAREVEDSLEVERVVGVQVDVEERLAVIVKYLAVELRVFLVGAFGRVLLPERVDVVDRLGLCFFFRLVGSRLVLRGGVVLFLLVGFYDVEINLNRHERAVFFEYAADTVLVEELVLVLHYVHDDVGTAFGAVVVLGNLVFARLGADPLDRAVARIRPGDHIDRVADHERRVEAETEVTDDAVVLRVLVAALVFLYELERARQRDLADVTTHLVLGHADAVVRNGECARLLVKRDGYAVVLVDILGFAERDEPL